MPYNPFNLNQKTILITGASSGIGKATAILCAKMGANIIAVARNHDRLLDLKLQIENIGTQIEIIEKDLIEDKSVDDIVESIQHIDGLVLCAGKGMTLPVQFCDRKKFDEIFEINLFSSIELTRLLYKKKKLNKGSSIVALSSMGGLYIFSGVNSIYGASKAALDSFMKFAAKEFSTRGIRVNTICPGMVDTPLIHRGTISEDQLRENSSIYPLKRFGNPEDIATAVVFLLSDASSWITGTSLIVDGGLSIS